MVTKGSRSICRNSSGRHRRVRTQLRPLRVNATTTDYRDLLLIYGTTTDARMIESINGFIPDILEKSSSS